MSSSSYTDLSGLFQIQKAMLNDISSQVNNGTLSYSDGTITNLQNMSTQLDNYNTAFDSANLSSQQVLDNQQAVEQILQNEYNRLLMKKQNVDNAYEGRQRAAFLNDNYRKRYSQYTKIVVIIISTLVICYILESLKPVFTFFPDFVYNMIMFIIVVIAIMMCYYTYMVIIYRDRIYFDQLDLPPPDLSNNPIGSGKGSTLDLSGYSGFHLSGCIDGDCCDGITTFWDANKNQCVVDNTNVLNVFPTTSPNTNKQGFTNIEHAYNNDKKYMNSVDMVEDVDDSEQVEIVDELNKTDHVHIPDKVIPDSTIKINEPSEITEYTTYK
jgi:hypothetical protein